MRTSNFSILISTAAFFFSSSLVSQAPSIPPAINHCGTEVPTQQWEQAFQQLLQQNSNVLGKQQAAVYTIPVIVHIIHGGQSVGTYPNLAAGQVSSQIQALNNDYAGTGIYSNNYPASAYSAYAAAQGLPANNLDPNGRIKIANCNVQFCLATKDTLGNILPEPGIDRVNYTTKVGWSNPATLGSYNAFKNFIDGTVKPQTIWNVSKYLNIWVTDENLNATGGLLGYATFPPLSGLGASLPSSGTNTTDGFWCYALTFGSSVYYPSFNYYSGYDKGRTCTHEIGHWLGLRHIWGDATCATDYCNDTPPGSASNSGTPSYPYKTTNCSGNSPNGEMFMNFMDYTSDNGKYMFTTDQATRIQTAMTNSPYRKFLGTHGLCSVANIAATATFVSSGTACSGNTLSLLNNSSGTPAPSFTWSANGNASFNPGPNAASPVISFPQAGTFTVSLTANNGSTSVQTKTIIVNATPTLVLTPAFATVCPDEAFELKGEGGISYAWQPGAQLGDIVSYITNVNQNYTCVVTGPGNCKSSGTVEIVVTDCTGLKEFYSSNGFLKVFPNPAHDKLIITSSIDHASELTIRLLDIAGKTLLLQTATMDRNANEVQLQMDVLEKGIYFLQLSVNGETVQSSKIIKE